jgi:hypothetical protein
LKLRKLLLDGVFAQNSELLADLDIQILNGEGLEGEMKQGVVIGIEIEAAQIGVIFGGQIVFKQFIIEIRIIGFGSVGVEPKQRSHVIIIFTIK